MNKHLYTIGLVASLMLAACSDEPFKAPDDDASGLGAITLAGQIAQENVSRANDDGFADGDEMGVYIVDYNGNIPGTLMASGNRGDNVHHTFDQANNRWNSAYDVYWKDKHTRIDVYGYYPYGSPADVNNYEFTVLTNQARANDGATMGDYEASDFLWGNVEGVEPTDKVIRLPLTHRMANVRVTLVEGAGFGAGEWAELEKQVMVTNTIRDAVIDLATGSVTPAGEVSANAITPSKRGDEWRAIVVPQTIPAGVTMLNITVGGMTYKFSRAEAIEYVSGKMSNFAIRVDNKAPTGDYALTLISESITPWENDLVSHDATAKEYVIIDCPDEGGLKNAIEAAGKDFTHLRNLKITGKIGPVDFDFMRDEMPMLQALNLKETLVANGLIPDYAFFCKTSLTSITLPDALKVIGCYAFSDCPNLSGSLIIPEGVTEVKSGAFRACKSLTGSLSLPSTLKVIGANVYDGGSGAFMECGFTCELQLPDNLEFIGCFTFSGDTGLYGGLHLPAKLKQLCSNAFGGCRNITGSLEIPQGITEIPSGAFEGCGFNGNLVMHDGIASLGEEAFMYCPFRGELALPKDLSVISNSTFAGCDFSGELVLPKHLITIGNNAFGDNWRLMGTLEFCEGLLTIGEGAFAGCRSLEGLVFPESLENIRAGAFGRCYGIGSIVSKSHIPPYIQQGAFDGVAKNNFTLEVPEAALVHYQTAAGWCEFKRISAHHELVCRPSVACALATEHKQTLIIDAEGDWEVESMPDWCELSQTTGFKKTEVQLTIKAASATEQRKGDVVFRLKDKDYTSRCHVSQYGYEYGEDEYIALQNATRGNNGGINIVILGDGYDAKEIADGTYLKDMKEEVEYFFGIEPYATYRDYFNVYTAFPLSSESGVGTVNSIRYNRFNTTYGGGAGLSCDYDELIDYILKAPTVNNANLNQTLAIVVPNSTDYGGVSQMWSTGFAISFCPKSTYGYPLDSRGVIQHEAGGHGFGKLGDECIYVNAFIDPSSAERIQWAKELGWYDNLELTGKMHQVGWSHLIFDPRYSDKVDIFEGGFMYSRGVFRSEQNSCMNNAIPYYSAISRESIVRRIKRYAGEEFDFDDFVANDKHKSAAPSRSDAITPTITASRQCAPVLHKGDPLAKRPTKNNPKP